MRADAIVATSVRELVEILNEKKIKREDIALSFERDGQLTVVYYH